MLPFDEAAGFALVALDDGSEPERPAEITPEDGRIEIVAGSITMRVAARTDAKRVAELAAALCEVT
ncbi:hypothetical protein DDZ14_02695 [Maritimibacter sp. 55A14]|uniref:hypothetical protein n=1 Tax=Maritimibacter sp. 55A14 TaxID=2174844 RepID=UPI000D621FA2|nr:hypothetical protein [Maritimibacter sp. 55A14]PWE34085.1 hypothetical protein DDZ14_02695 [Maritimibacter sp. 55A14]